MRLRTSQLEEMALSQNTQQTGIQMVSILVISIKITKEIMVTVLQLWEDHHTAQEFNTEVFVEVTGIEAISIEVCCM